MELQEFKVKMNDARNKLIFGNTHYSCTALNLAFQENNWHYMSSQVKLYEELFKTEKCLHWLSSYFDTLFHIYIFKGFRINTLNIRLGLLDCFEGFCIDTKVYEGW